MGEVPINWQEIKAWQDLHGIDMQPWELSIIKNASSAFVGMLSEARNQNCPPPFRVEIDHVALEKRMKSILRGTA